MKRKLFGLLILFLALLTPVLRASAAETDFEETFFADGSLSAVPLVPYADIYSEYEDGSQHNTEIYLCCFIPEEIQGLVSEYLNLSGTGTEDADSAFDKLYGTDGGFHIYIQVDAKFNDGSWLSESGDWDRLSYSASVPADNKAFCLLFELSKKRVYSVYSLEQVLLSKYEADSADCAFFSDYVRVAKNQGGGVAYQLNLSTNTVYYRYRYCVTYCRSGEEYDNDYGNILVGAWSETISIGAEGSQKTITEPEAVCRPILSDFEFNGTGQKRTCTFKLKLSDEALECIKYYMIYQFEDEPYTLEVQVKKGDEEWHALTVSMDDAVTPLNSEYVVSASFPWISFTNKTELLIRARFTDSSGNVSDWSNCVGNAAEAVNNPTATPTPTPATQETIVTETKGKCSFCGICPFQPLGICLFIWIAVILLLVLVTVLIVRKIRRRSLEDDEWIAKHNEKLERMKLQAEDMEPEPEAEQETEDSENKNL